MIDITILRRVPVRSVVRLILVVSSIIIFIRYVVYDKSGGLEAYGRLHGEITHLEERNAEVSAEIAEIERDIAAWQENSFELERQAREDLLMGKPGEQVYILKK